ncbi:hypothetical protein [Arthrobacter sp.]|uniref:hypothetical protein n=1 Tax=Arthrobacter sp. TaxID=1667 RepID=UPI003A8D4BEA
MKRPHPVSGLYVVTIVLWLVSLGCAAVAATTFDPAAVGLSLPTALAGAAAIGSGLFALWTGWRACRALDFLVATTR